MANTMVNAKLMTKDIGLMVRPNITSSISARFMIKLCKKIPTIKPTAAPIIVNRMLSRLTYWLVSRLVNPNTLIVAISLVRSEILTLLKLYKTTKASAAS